MRCAHCGYPIPEADWLNELTGQQRRVAEIILHAGQRGVHTDCIVDAIYSDDPNGGALTASNVVAVCAVRINQRLARFGVQVHRQAGLWRVYRAEAMTKLNELSAFINDIEKRAYERGFNDGVKACRTAVLDVQPKSQKKPRTRAAGLKDKARMMIADHPGQRTDQLIGDLPEFKEQSIRSCLSQMKADGALQQRDGGWYVNGEARA